MVLLLNNKYEDGSQKNIVDLHISFNVHIDLEYDLYDLRGHTNVKNILLKINPHSHQQNCSKTPFVVRSWSRSDQTLNCPPFSNMSSKIEVNIYKINFDLIWSYSSKWKYQTVPGLFYYPVYYSLFQKFGNPWITRSKCIFSKKVKYKVFAFFSGYAKITLTTTLTMT